MNGKGETKLIYPGLADFYAIVSETLPARWFAWS